MSVSMWDAAETSICPTDRHGSTRLERTGEGETTMSAWQQKHKHELSEEGVSAPESAVRSGSEGWPQQSWVASTLPPMSIRLTATRRETTPDFARRLRNMILKYWQTSAAEVKNPSR